MSVISPCHLRHEVVRPSQASRVTHSARADVRTRESSIATPPAGNTTETNTAGYQSKKPVVLHQMNQHPPPTRPGWRRVRYARKWFPSWAIGGNASLGRAARGAFACSGPRRATSHRCGRPERTSPSRKAGIVLAAWRNGVTARIESKPGNLRHDHVCAGSLRLSVRPLPGATPPGRRHPPRSGARQPPRAQPKSHSPTYRRRAQHDEYGGIEYAALPVNSAVFVITLCCSAFERWADFR
jgi:hypothetical protein